MRSMERNSRIPESWPARSHAKVVQRLRLHFLRPLVIGAAAFAFAACTSNPRSAADRRSTPVATVDEGAITNRAGTAPVPVDDIPPCFIENEPAAAVGPERTDAFQPAPRSPTPTPKPGVPATATPRPTPEVAKIATAAAFPLYALNAPVNEIAPLQMRVSTVPAGTARQVSLFVLQYRVAAQRGSIVIMVSSPSSAKIPAPNDLDDALDAIRLEARLPGTPRAADPLADPGAALRSVGCPARENLTVPIEGGSYPALLVTWPGLPRVTVLRAETGHGALTIEAGAIDRSTLLALLSRLVSLQTSPQAVAALQGYFGGSSLASLGPAQRTATPARQRTATPRAGLIPMAMPVVR